jgi:CobQ/CobB/MinD/ParA nucleotide binding domain
MLIFATSDKGGTGRSVTGCNLAYRLALRGLDVCYVDFDFGSPTAGAIFELAGVATGTEHGGLHSVLQGRSAEPLRFDVWAQSDRDVLRSRPASAGDLVLFPGDRGGGEFMLGRDALQRCTELFLRLEAEFDVCFVDLSAGRSHAIDAVLEVTARPELRATVSRWIVFHRWTRQHIVAAADLLYGEHGMLATGVDHGHDEDALRSSIRLVRTAVLDLRSPELAQIPAAQAQWLADCNRDLLSLAASKDIGRTVLLGQTPMDPVLQWREQLISDTDVVNHIANEATVGAFTDLADRMTVDASWEGL